MKRNPLVLFIAMMAFGPAAFSQDTAGDSQAAFAIMAKAEKAKTAMTNVSQAETGKKKEAAYKKLLKEFPPELPDNKNIPYPYLRDMVASRYALEDNVGKALEYADVVLAQLLAKIFIRNGHLIEASRVLKTAIDSAISRMAQPAAYNHEHQLTSYVRCCNMYAAILYTQGDYPAALRYIRNAYDSAKQVEGDLNENYAKVLMAVGRDQEAFDKIDEAVKAGRATHEMEETLGTLYPKVMRNNEGYDAYMAVMRAQLVNRFLPGAEGRMIDQPAPPFTLTDLDGKSVSLNDYKGKIVVLDFWATWCVPCKASFPVMEEAVNRYKDSDDVKFLFIHTWERESDPTWTVRKYLKEMNYSFRVLMDLKDKGSGINGVVTDFQVTGIPTKFIIDRNGHIRFRITGFSSVNTAAVEELAAMIQLVQKS